jgi:O-antigen biosynthesis protein WbqP
MLYARWGKRLLDVTVAGIALLALAPLLLLIAAAIRLEDGGPALFVQQRVGRGGLPFRLFKFRSMPVGTASVPSAEAAALPLTRVGRAIRRTNLDELPQLLNVLSGDMSLVGPRPALASEARLLALRRANGAVALQPGLTGAAQVHSYDGMPDAEKARWDGWYAGRVTLARDLALILRTVPYLLRRPPVY